MKQGKKIRNKLNKDNKMIMYTRIKYSILLIIPLILLILLPAVSFADADRISKENSEAIEAYKQAIRIGPEKAKELFKSINK